MSYRMPQAERLLKLLTANGPMLVSEIADALQVKRGTVSSYVTEARRICKPDEIVTLTEYRGGVVRWTWYRYERSEGQREMKV